MLTRNLMTKMIVLVILFCFVEGVVTEAGVQKNVFRVVGEYTMSDDEIKTLAQERAVQIAMADGVMQSAVYIKSFSKMMDSQISDDVIQAAAAGVIKVKQKKITSTITPSADICLRAELTLEIDSDEVEQYLPEIMRNWQLVEENKLLRIEFNRIMSEIAVLKNKLLQAKNEQERRYIEEQIALNEASFSAMQWFEKGRFFANKDEHVMSVECYNKAISLDPNKAVYYAQRGCSLFSMDKYDEALRDFNSAIEVDKNCMIAYYHRAWYHIVRDEYQAAIDDYSHTIELAPHFFAAYGERAFAHTLLKQYDDALIDCNKAISLNEYNRLGLAMAYGHRAFVYHQMGNEVASEADKQRAIQLDPDYYNQNKKKRIIMK